MLADLREDWSRYTEGGGSNRVRLLLTQGVWAVAEYRFGRWARAGAPTWARPVAVAASIVTHLFVEILTGISISPSAEIGPGLYIGHFGSIFVNSRARLGAGCTLSQEVTIGQGADPPHESPRIGRGVYIAPGAKVFGGIEIGDHVAIGANAVVRDDVPDRGIAVGIPAKVVRVQDPDEVRVAPIAR